MVLGYWENISYYKVVGLGILFIFSFLLMNSGVDYQTGAIINETSIGVNEITYTYSNYQNTTLSILIMAIASFGFITVFAGKEI